MRTDRTAHRFVLALALLLVAAGAGGADTVSGYVVDARSGERLGGIEVAFQVPDGAGAFREMMRKATGEDGSFAFSGPFLTEGTRYVLAADYKGLDYPTDPLTVGQQDGVILEVFDGTEDDGQIRFDAHHLFLTVTPEGIEVAHLIHVDNGGTSTYMGRASGDGRHVLELPLPEGNTALQTHTGDLHRDGPTQLATTEPLPPGRSQFAFTLRMDGEQFTGDYEHEVAYPTQRLELFLQPADIELPTTSFEDLGTVDLHDQSYRHYRVTDLVRGRLVSIPLPYERPVRWALKWAMLGLGLVLAIAALATIRPMADPRADLEAERQRLLDELAAIDDRRDAGQSRPGDDEARQQGLQRLSDLYRRLDGAS
jgi:hypothetical protein